MERTGIIGGSGLYELEGFKLVERREVETPYGPPSDAIMLGDLDGHALAFLPRHGLGHRHCPSMLPVRANIWALKSLGVTRLISVSAVGSMREEIAPGDMVVIDQLIDRTVGRERTFFDDGIAAHVAFANPVSEPLRVALHRAAASVVGRRAHDGGTYICIEGPQFSTRAESQLFRTWGVSVIGMTALPEARLAREAEIDYAVLALATDYDCWHESEEDVTVEGVLAVMRQNVANAAQIVRKVVDALPHSTPDWPARHALDGAIMTDPARIPAHTMRSLSPLLSRVFGKNSESAR